MHTDLIEKHLLLCLNKIITIKWQILTHFWIGYGTGSGWYLLKSSQFSTDQTNKQNLRNILSDCPGNEHFMALGQLHHTY